MCVNASSGWWQLFLDTKTCESIPTPDGPTRASEEAPGARARKREDVATSKRQGGAGGGEEYATASGVDRRVRVPAQAPGGQPFPRSIPGIALPSFHRSLGGGSDSCRRAVARARSLLLGWMPYPNPVQKACLGELTG